MKTITLIITAVLYSTMALAQNAVIDKETDKTIVSEPTFTGIQKTANIDEFLRKNLNYPDVSEKFLTEGTVVIRFNVLPSGKLSKFKIINSVSDECDEAVISTLKASNGMWNPGTIDGNPVTMEREATVAFTINGNNMYKSAREYAARADILLNEGKYNRAIRLYNKAIVIVPNHAVTLYQRGIAKYYNGDKNGAMNDFERIDDLGSNLADQLMAKLVEDKN